MPKCSYRGCSHEAASLGQLRKHYVEAGHKTKRKKRDETPPPTQENEDLETALLTKAVALFTSAETDGDSDERVLRYLITRFAPQIVAPEAAEEAE